MSGPQFSSPTPEEESPALALIKQEPAAMVVAETSSTAVAARERAQVEARFLVAKKLPRDFDASRLRLLKACARPAFAATARYSKPVGGKSITGLSVRFAEECARLWGNLAVDATVVFDDPERRIYRVTAVDLETNNTSSQDVIVEKFVERRSTKTGDVVMSSRMNSTGNVVYTIGATEDAVLVKANAMISKTRRNLILQMVPADVREECEAVVIETMSERDAKDPEGQKREMLRMFFARGVEPAQVFELLGVSPDVALTPAQFALARSWYTALMDGESSWAEIVEAGLKAAKPAPIRAAKKAPLKERLREAAAAVDEEDWQEPDAPAREPGEE